MKKISIVLTILLALSVTAHAQTVGSANIMGYSKVGLRPGGKWEMVTCNFVAESNTLQDIFGTDQLAQSGSISECDKIVIYDATALEYETYAQWTDGNFYNADSQLEFNNSSVVNPQIPLGSAAWIITSSTSTDTNTVLISGDVVSASIQSIETTNGFQMLSYPFSADIAINDTDFATDGAAQSGSFSSCDKISVWEGSGYQTYGLYIDGKWYKANDAIEWNTAPLATNTIRISQGFWYNGQGAFAWTESNPYSTLFD